MNDHSLLKIFFPVLSLSLMACSQKQPVEETYIPLEFETELSNGLYVPRGWEVTKWAVSPMFFNPTNIDVDHEGRLWVTEAVNYRDFNNREEGKLVHSKGDRVMILEDTDGDGKADVSKVFVQDTMLVAPMGIAVFENKVVVSCAPNLLIYTDDDGDDKADRREILLTGFGGFDHDHSLHSVVAGPDGKWYFNTGNAGPHTVTDASGWTLRSGSMYTGGTPYNKENSGNRVSDDGRVWVGGLALRVNPDGTGLKVMGHNFRNSYEVVTDSYGNLWQNDNDDQVVTCRFTWLMEGGNAGFFSKDGSRTWQYDRRPYQDNFTAHWHQEDPGVIPAGDNTGSGSPTGVAVYEGDLFGPMYKGMVLSVDAGRNVVFAYKPKPNGAGFELMRTNLISSLKEQPDEYKWNDLPADSSKWFRPSDVAVGADGALFVADWFDPIVGGHQMVDKAGYGVIYRVAPKGNKPEKPQIDLHTTNGQLKALLNPAVNVRYGGFTKLVKNGEKDVEEIKVLLESDDRFIVARAIWLLASMGEKGRLIVEKMLSHTTTFVRTTAYRALRNQCDETSLIVYANRMTGDTAREVRREVAISLRDIPFDRKKEIILELIKGYDGKDPWYREALVIGLDRDSEKLWPFLLEYLGSDPMAWDEKASSLVWAFHPRQSVPYLFERASSGDVTVDERKKMIVALAFINDTSAVNAMEKLTNSEWPDVASHARWWMAFRKNNEWLSLRNWDTEETSFTSMTVRENEKKPTYTLEEVSMIKGSAERGAKAFEARCSVCHVFQKSGRDIGPELSVIRRKFDRNGLLLSIMYPNSGISFGYELWTITTTDGKEYSGILLADGKTVVLKDLTGVNVSILSDNILMKKQVEGSIMPGPVELNLSASDLADLAAFLLGEEK